jgi:hypothetical protein
VSRRKSRIASYLEQRLTTIVNGPPEVQRAAQVRLELLPVAAQGGRSNEGMTGAHVNPLLKGRDIVVDLSQMRAGELLG